MLTFAKAPCEDSERERGGLCCECDCLRVLGDYGSLVSCSPGWGWPCEVARGGIFEISR